MSQENMHDKENLQFNWYAVHVYSGSERRVKEDIVRSAEQMELSHLIEQILVPVMSVPEIKNGSRVEVSKKFMPNYILVKIAMNDAIWKLIKNTNRVTGFLGDARSPAVLSKDEVDNVFRQIEITQKRVEDSVKYMIGDSVDIIDGPFESFVGIIEEVLEEESKLRVAVTIFGRVTPIELQFTQIKKMQNKEHEGE
jgi:transcriptional antiterminator NusG